MSSQVMSSVITSKSSSHTQRKPVHQTPHGRAVEIVRELEKQRSCDPRTLIKMLHQAANKLSAVGNFKMASVMYKKITTINSELYGSGHPRTICSNTREIMTYNKQLDINNKMRAYIAAQKSRIEAENKQKKEDAEKKAKKEAKKEAKM